MTKGTQVEIMTPGTNAKHYLAGALDLATGTLHHCMGPRKTNGLFRNLLQTLEATYPAAVASKGLPANNVYSATKAAVRSFARTWTTDLKDRRIRVNAVSPGPIETPGLHDLMASTGAGEQRLKMLANSVPLGRLGTPNEIAKAAVFLASDDSSYITGTDLFVDGGMAQV
jgi:NAD(P)-dependent dehydrogenase (short-subunit alcohol dehydrogenase family)